MRSFANVVGAEENFAPSASRTAGAATDERTTHSIHTTNEEKRNGHPQHDHAQQN
jgi:hypothetical protein